MKERSGLRRGYLYVIVGFVILGLTGVQLYWMRTGIRMQQLAAERNLKSDLNKLFREVEEDAYCFYYYSKAYIKKGEGIYLIKQSHRNGVFTAPPEGYIDTMSMYNLFHFEKDSFFDKNNSITFQTPATVDISLKFKFAVPSPHVKKIDTNSYKLPNINMANFQAALGEGPSLDGLINPDRLDSLIKETLKKNDFDTVYELGIRRMGARDYEYLRKGSTPAHLENGLLRTAILGDNFNKPYELSLYLADPAGHTIRSMSWVMACSLIIIVVLIVAFVWFVKTILNQKKLSEMKSMFINNITHEFNTPITNISLAVENWRNAGTNADYYTRIIEEENRHMQRNVEQMLQLSAIDHTRIRRNIDRIELDELARETVAAFAIQLERINGRVDYNIPAGIWMYGDRTLVRNLLYNLIDNAIKYSRDNLQITIAASEADNRVTIEVQDNGIGMTVETMKYIFERFYRGDKGDRHDVKGFGIGLSYVKYIVDAHKGYIQVRSRKNEGTRFTIQFPKNLKA